MIKDDMRTIMLCFCIMLTPALIKGQVIKGLRSDNTGQFPRLEWYSGVKPDTTVFRLFRGSVDKEDFVMVLPQYYLKINTDTTFYVIFDTTLTRPGIYRYYIDVPGKQDTIHSEILFGQTHGFTKTPYIETFTANPVTGKKVIRLEWKLNDTRTVQGLALFRSRSYKDGYELIARLEPDAEFFEDPVERSNEPWFYFLQIRDFFGYQPPSVRIHGFSTYASVPLPPQEMSAVVVDGKVRLRFRKVGEDIIGFNIYRREGNKSQYLMVARKDVTASEWYELKDTVPFSPQVRELFYYATAISDGYLESNPGDTAVLPLPSKTPVPPPTELEVLTGADGNRLVIWSAMDSNPDVAGFNVFRKALNTSDPKYQEPVKINHTLLSADQNFWIDSASINSGEYLYEVESVNLAGVASTIKTGTSIDYSIEKPILILSSTQDQNGIILSWKELSDPGVIKLNLYRQHGDQKPLLMKIFNNISGEWTDTQTDHGNSYIYFVEAEYRNGLKQMVNEGFLVRRIAP